MNLSEFSKIFVSKILDIHSLEIGISDTQNIYHYAYYFYLTGKKCGKFFCM